MRFQFENLIRMMPPLPLTAFLFLAGSFQCLANDKHPVPDFGTSREITLAEFLRKVAAANLDYAAQRYSIPIAKAQIAAAKVSPNPAGVFSYTGDVSGEKQASIYSSGFFQTIEMGGKRGSRVAVAQKNYLTAAATVEDFFRTLRGTAAGAFIDAVADRMIVEQKRSSYEVLDKLATTNQKRFEAGDLDEVDADQARVDALQARDDLHSSESDAATAAVALVQLMGTKGAAVPTPVGHLQFRVRSFDLQTVLSGAMQRRPDVVAARHSVESAQAAIRLARANRYPDLTVGLSLAHNTRTTNKINPAPDFDVANVSVSVPLPIFNSFRGEYEAAVQTALQSETTLKSITLKAEVDVRTNFKRYDLAGARLAQYEGAALQLAQKVLQARLISYQKGAATLLDVLIAQKADNDFHLAYISALTERAKALVVLEQAAAMWDLDDGRD
jgi:cobalt-zinc-cadmium efflux system outer membrane protein